MTQKITLAGLKEKAVSRAQKAPTAAQIRTGLLGHTPVTINTVKSPAQEAKTLPPAAVDSTPVIKLNGSGLVPEGFEFDPSQLIALEALASQSHGCMIGAAGTGKTTCTKAFVQHVAHSVKSIDANYDKRKDAEAKGNVHQELMTPSILLCAFTGRAVRQIKKNFPKDWHPNIMTIHRALKFAPEFIEELGEDGDVIKKRVFLPRHSKANPMPWQIIIIDEASMVALDLWEQFYDAMLPNTRIYMVGDLNQLPPVQGRSIFGYALAKWNVAELTHVHRQKESTDEIVPNAHRVLKGQSPVSGGNVQMREIPQHPKAAGQQVVAYIKALSQKGSFDPRFDALITAVNGDKWESPSAPLGQIPLNDPLSRFFNGEDEDGNPRKRVMIDAGRSRKVFAVGDKVMATKNDYETGITNGMMGIITSISLNHGYIGDMNMVGDLEQVEQYIAAQQRHNTVDAEELLEDISESLTTIGTEKPTESFMRGQASHTITVDFRACESEGADDDSDEQFVEFTTRAEIESLQLAYASTCHKMQGSECPLAVVVVHEAFGQMLCREWFYTAITRASKKLLILYTKRGMDKAVMRQRIKGVTVKEKANSFRKLMEDASRGKMMLGNAGNVMLPEPVILKDSK